MGVEFRKTPRLKVVTGISQYGFSCPRCGCKKISTQHLKKIKDNTNQLPNYSIGSLYTEFKNALTSRGILVQESTFLTKLTKLCHFPTNGGSRIYLNCKQRLSLNFLPKFLNLRPDEKLIWRDWCEGQEANRSNDIWLENEELSDESEKRHVYTKNCMQARKEKKKYVNMPEF